MNMDASKIPMNTVSRRTRSQWDIFYRNRFNEVKGIKTQESGETSVEKHDFGITGGNTGGVDMTVQDEGSGTRDVKRISGSGNIGETVKKMIAGDAKNNNLAGIKTRLRSRKKFDMRANNDDDDVGKGDDEVIYLSEEVVSNGLSSKVGSESRSGSHSKLSVDEIVSCSSKQVEKTSLITDQVKNSVVCGRGRLGIKHLNERRVDDASINLENAVDSADSALKSDGSDTSAESLLYGPDSSSKDNSTDEDYKEIEPSGSDGSHCSSDAEQKEDDEYEVGDDDDSPIKINAHPGEENSSNSIENKKTFILGTKSMKVKGKKENDVEQVKNNENNEGCDGDGNDNSCTRINSDRKKIEEIIIIVDGEEPNVRKSTRMKGKRDDELVRINRLHKPCSNYISMDGARKLEDSSVNLEPKSASKREDDTVIVTDLKKRKTSDFDVCLDFYKHNKNTHGSITKHLQSPLISKSQKKKNEQGNSNSPVIVIESDESASSTDEEPESLIKEAGFQIKHTLKRSQATKKAVKLTKKKIRLRRNFDMIRMLEDPIDALRESASPTEESVWTQIYLPLKFRFEDEVQPQPERSEWEKEIDSLFGDLEMGLRECEIGYPNSSETDIDDIISPEIDASPAASCQRGEHYHILDEEIGIRCKYCEIVFLEIKYVLPPFYTSPLGGRDRKEFAESRSLIFDQIQLQHPACGIPDYAIRTQGTIWELMAGIENVLYPHQREGLEFIWKNVAGDIHIEKLKGPLSDGGRGCIISHAPGTGKTRLTIAFLLTFMKLYPTCRPVVVAPRGMLFTWEDELSKWQVDVPFHNMNKEELSDNESNMASIIFGQVGGSGIGLEHIRLAKLYSWMKRKSILGISYRLFEQLAGDKERRQQNEQIRRLLLESPGVLVLDEGHTARNSKSLMWKALTKVATQRRIMLTGTPFQNNFTELYNTLCLVNPKFVNHFKSDETRQICSKKRGRKSDEAKSKFMDFASSICKNTDEELKKLRAMLDPFVHLHKGSILQDSLPGLRNTLVFLHPTELQKTLLEIATKEGNIFHRIQLVSLISVHPSLVSKSKRFSDYKNELEEIELTVDAGVKTKFIMNLISLADALGERVLIFSQFLDPLVFIKKQLESHFSWNEGKQVLYMDGQSDMKHRQEKIASFNDHSSKAKVLLASQRACSEGISLVGASRVILIDTVWNPSVERQAVSRAFRLGQKRLVFVYRLMTSGSEFMQYAQQAEKDRMSQLIFSPVDEDTYSSERSCSVWDDKVLDALVNLENFKHSFAKIIHQPKESDLIEILKSVDLR
ncbi:SNF2 domain-containing protein CLASSY 4-like [Primulina eburnea]|uniref:SNF2 domain-containing protein CLASSY 4-like n=1 Tax=Primulina eburnea TaxID=1245227 RepID=UPI003C6BF4B4